MNAEKHLLLSRLNIIYRDELKVLSESNQSISQYFAAEDKKKDLAWLQRQIKKTKEEMQSDKSNLSLFISPNKISL